MYCIEKKCRYLLILLLLFCFLPGYAQQAGSCPPNIGFEQGDFSNWECSYGGIDFQGNITLNGRGVKPNVHTIFTNSGGIPENDPYGSFPVTCPNGSGYSIRLGNSLTQGEAERVSYTFTIPAGQEDYSIIYNYAVVIQNPDHQDYEQPKFTSRVFDVTGNSYVECGSFQFVASASLPGFIQSPTVTNVFYKPWSPITIKLMGYGGKTIRLEFTNNDCTRGGHFGYAYLDVNENCSSPISGNTYCNGATSVDLTAPFGFKEYRWFNENFTTQLGDKNVLTISPPPPPGTRYALEIVPYPGLGCLDTLYSTVQHANEAFNLQLKDTMYGCANTGVDLTQPIVTAGSTADLTFAYYIDSFGLEYLAAPKMVSEEGPYYIKAANKAGCTDTKPVYARIHPVPNLKINTPATICAPQVVDITLPQVTQGSDPGLMLSYYTSQQANTVLPNPASVSNSGTYYIKATSFTGCNTLQPVQVQISKLPTFNVQNQTGCGRVDLTKAVAGNEAGLTYQYWQDAAASIAVQNEKDVTATGTYYIQATNIGGCSLVRSVEVVIAAAPTLVVADPQPVIYPNFINAALLHNTVAGAQYRYCRDSAGNVPLEDAGKILQSGRYFIHAINQQGCTTITPFNVVILPPPDPIVEVANAFSPNNDGINDVFKINIAGVISSFEMQVYNRWGQPVFSSGALTNMWDGTVQGKTAAVGTYYWVCSFIDTFKNKKVTKTGWVALLK